MRRASLAGWSLLLSVTACERNPLVVRTDEPMLYVTLSRTGLGPGDTVVGAVLGITGDPTRFEYLEADAFEMRRESDGAPFDWRLRELPAGADGAFLPREPNYVLAPSATAAGLGRADLAPGQSYVFSIVAGGRTIHGRTRVPEVPVGEIVADNGSLIARWRRVPGAGGYLAGGSITRDTFRVLGPVTSGPLTLLVSAVDSNWMAYMAGTNRTSAGVTGAFGLVAAMATGEVARTALPRGNLMVSVIRYNSHCRFLHFLNACDFVLSARRPMADGDFGAGGPVTAPRGP